MYMVTSPCSRYDTEVADEAATLLEVPRTASSATSITTLPCRFMSSSLSVSRWTYESIAALPRPMLSFVPRRNRFQCAFGAVGSRTPGIVRLVARSVRLRLRLRLVWSNPLASVSRGPKLSTPLAQTATSAQATIVQKNSR